MCTAGNIRPARRSEPSGERMKLPERDRVGQFDTRAGSIELATPKRGRGSSVPEWCFPDWLLEPRKRPERAVVQVVCRWDLRACRRRWSTRW